MLTALPSPDDQKRLALRERPSETVVSYQSWRNLLFLSWRVDVEVIQRRLPNGLFVDRHQGSAYVTVSPFFMRHVRMPYMPAIPWISNFLELNVRTYVFDADGTPGIWFYALDCNQALAVAGGRAAFHLPYRRSAMEAIEEPTGIRFRSHPAPAGTFDVHYQAANGGRVAEAGSLEFFLIERYALFSVAPSNQLYLGRVHHAPYRLAPVRLLSSASDLLGRFEFDVEERTPDDVRFCNGVDVEVFWPRPVPLRS